MFWMGMAKATACSKQGLISPMAIGRQRWKEKSKGGKGD
jgi:hypothetical protein